ncbi:patatin-like phospholipase family protein [Alkalimarinus alittae]|uniref:Patatin-like phospholipase family protein n=1 Tax=Alkalimarinus alittae TaxID=2961619 RepID=A0ABY6N2Q0_9ALTE|nr:patatin-like phospholipase family protein [Alkalimarinus alittae]UZE96361.1 patatin-like phospholipase family protein [Alkalimarinus alittae]
MKKVRYQASLLIVLVIFIYGCASTRPAALPSDESARLPWGALDLDIESDHSEYTLKKSMGEALEIKLKNYSGSETAIPLNILALSGGGSGGAYGAGVLSGWKERGDLPQFDIVTGISTGSIMASFAFLGGENIDTLQDIFTTLETENLYTSRLLNWFSQASINDTRPLKEKLIKGINEPFLAKIAAEHKKGRRLYMGTTNLDTGQLVVWDMGAIASSNRPNKVQRYRDIIYASSAVPILFPPQFIEVDVEEKKFYQMHVDGGLYSNVFMIGLLVNWSDVLHVSAKNRDRFDANLYVIANRKYRESHAYKPSPLEATEVIGSLLLVATDLLFDRTIHRIYESAQTRNIKFHMATIPNGTDFISSPMDFIPEEMQGLFSLAYEQALSGYPWQTKIELDEYDKSGR